MLPLPIAKKYRSVWNQHLTKNLKFTQEKSAGVEQGIILLLQHTQAPRQTIVSLRITVEEKCCENQLKGNRCNAVIFADHQIEDTNGQSTAMTLQVSQL